MQLNNSIKMIELTHANTGDKIAVVAHLVFAYYLSAAHKATIVVGSAGAMFPVRETPEEVSQKLTS